MNIYEDAGKDMYDIYYDGIIKDAYDTEDYDVWSDASSDIYEFQSDLRSEVYDHDDERVQKKMDKFKKSILRMKEDVNDQKELMISLIFLKWSCITDYSGVQ